MWRSSLYGTLLFGVIALGVFAGLERFPGLHLDEARFGLQAMDRFAGGLDSPHGMTAYSGPFQAHAVAWSFRVAGPGVWALRVPGAVLSVVALLVVAVFLARRAGERAVLAFLGLLATSLLFLWKARIAGEVDGIQAFVVAVVVVAANGLVSGRHRAAAFLILVCAIWVGEVNHVIFLSVPLSLAAAGLYAVFVCGDERFRGVLRAGIVGVGLAGVLAAKLALSDAVWRAHRVPVVACFVAAPLVAAAIGLRGRRVIDAVVDRLVGATGIGGTRGRTLIVFGLVVFGVGHLSAFAGAWSGVLLLERMASWWPPLALSVCLYALVGLILVPVGVRVHRALARRGALPDEPALVALMTVWAPAYLACFSILVHRWSIRYYLIPFWLTAVTVAVDAARASRADWRRLVAATACLGALALPPAAREMMRTENRRPIEFLCGWMIERSAHFMRVDAVAKRVRAERPCRIEGDDFLVAPLVFLREVDGPSCNPAASASVRYCPSCAPFYLSYSHRPAPGTGR
jgi:hypothetical protein